MLCWFQVYSIVIQPYIYIYILFFRFFSHSGYCRILSRVPHVIPQILIGYLFYMQQWVYANPKILIIFIFKRSLSCHIDLTYFSFLLNSTSPCFLTHLIIFLPSWNQLLLSQHLTCLYSSSTTTPHGSYLTLLISTFPLPPFYLHLLTSISYITSVASL